MATTTPASKISGALCLVAFSSIFLLQPAASNLVQTTCQKTPYYQLCVSNFQPDPRSSTADVPGLAAIAADKVKDKSSSTVDQIKSLQKGTQDPTLKHALSDCLDSYNAIISADVPEIIEAVAKGNPKFGEEAALDAAKEAESCGKKVGKTVPFSESNEVVHDLSLVVASIIKLLL